ncbi:MAG: cold shock domain-containing protein [Succinivibrionaceae bacterium]|nr:cold shock domain-containing protein [Succinivibrionaceae bacterium]
MNNQSGTVKMYSEKMCKSQTVQVKAPEIRIGGSIKFYDKQKDFGFIAADHGQDYYFRMSDFSQSVNGGLAPHTKVTFVPKSNRKKDKNSFATEIQLVNPPDNRVNTTKPAFRSDESLPPPCPHCGARKGSHFGWIDSCKQKIYLCNSCGKEHTYGDMLEYNKEMVKNAKISLVVGIVFICVVLIIILSHWHWR